GASSAPDDARISPIASGCPSQSTSSASPPAPRTNSQTHSPAALTSSACAGSALIDGMRRNAASSSNQSSAMAVESKQRGRVSPASLSPDDPLRRLRDVAELLRLGERAQL